MALHVHPVRQCEFSMFPRSSPPRFSTQPSAGRNPRYMFVWSAEAARVFLIAGIAGCGSMGEQGRG